MANRKGAGVSTVDCSAHFAEVIFSHEGCVSCCVFFRTLRSGGSDVSVWPDVSPLFSVASAPPSPAPPGRTMPPPPPRRRRPPPERRPSASPAETESRERIVPTAVGGSAYGDFRSRQSSVACSGPSPRPRKFKWY